MAKTNTMQRSNLLLFLKAKAEAFFLLLGIGIAVSLVWWPLLNSILCILFFANWLFLMPKQKPAGIRFFLLLLFCSIYLLSVIGLFYSQNKTEALSRLQVKLPLIIFPFIFSTLRSLPDNFFRKVFYAFSVSFAVFCLVCIIHSAVLYFQSGEINVLWGYDILVMKHYTPSSASLFCVIVIVFHLIVISRDQKMNYYNLAPAAVCTMMLLLLSNRLGLLLTVLLSVWIILTGLRMLKLKIILVVSIIALTSVVFAFNTHLRNKFKLLIQLSKESEIVLDTDASLGRTWDGRSIRIAIWKCAAGLIKNNIVAGVGTGDAQDELQKTYEQRQFYFASRYNRYDAHNQYLQQWIMNGIGGMLLLLGAILLPICFSVYRSNQFYFYFLVITGMFFLTESILEINKGIVLYSFFNSIFAFQLRRD